MPEEQQWFTVFEILFPECPKPRSPYVDAELSQEMHRFQDYLTDHGPGFITSFLQERGVFTCDLPQGERDLSSFRENILAEGLQQIVERWAAANSAGNSLDSSPDTSDPSRSRDSGIAIRDNLTHMFYGPNDFHEPELSYNGSIMLRHLHDNDELDYDFSNDHELQIIEDIDGMLRELIAQNRS
ncbi:hypothetical protein F5Y15DRAFT_415331 [Xylariaceae sp. FL0016]|nr:hypothetical protein F5Y15DRAFT_415331 [Xylariaceae sp. FL0016]